MILVLESCPQSLYRIGVRELFILILCREIAMPSITIICRCFIAMLARALSWLDYIPNTCASGGELVKVLLAFRARYRSRGLRDESDTRLAASPSAY